ncbi:MAG: helix-turn-helix domain-containing protein, partial [Bacteroidales bacterium]|nr:helix-turn-helix domain-containing protein [Bacteroidales bacterium]
VCSRGFSIMDYQRAKALAVLNEEETAEPVKPKKRPKKSEKKPKEPKEPKLSTYEITKSMIEDGLTPKEIAKERGLQLSTVYGHISRFIEMDEYDASQFLSEEHYDTIRDYFDETNDPSLGAAKDVLGDDYDFGEIRMVLSELKRDGAFAGDTD